ncbi:MAG: hypothetical protein NZ730_06620 [Porticoccaceae bacterium]|nr:hypothetical protein [Porticoccaceae bacterium]
MQTYKECKYLVVWTDERGATRTLKFYNPEQAEKFVGLLLTDGVSTDDEILLTKIERVVQ